MATIRELLAQGGDRLKLTSASARLDAELLLGHVLGKTRVELLAHSEEPVSTGETGRYLDLVERRKLSEPIAYLRGSQEFWSLEFQVSPAVLIPRPETECLVEAALKAILRCACEKIRILDLGTGSGCVAIALAQELHRVRRKFEIVAVDTSGEALAIAKNNAERHGVAAEVQFIQSNWCSEVDGLFDVVVGNPPYVETGSLEVSPETHFEPSGALYAGVDGLAAIEQILREAPRILAGSGEVYLECGYQHGELIRPLMSEPPYNKFILRQILPDYSGRDRILRFVCAP